MCCGEMLLGLPEDPSGKDLMAALILADDTCKTAKQAENAGLHGVLRSEGALLLLFFRPLHKTRGLKSVKLNIVLMVELILK